MSKEFTRHDLVKLQKAMKEFRLQPVHFSKIGNCLYCHKDKIEIWPENFIPMCDNCNIEISQILEYFFDKYPEMVEEILSNGNMSN